MWDILDYTCPKTESPQSGGRGVFDPTFLQNHCPAEVKIRGRSRLDGSGEDEEHDDDVVESQIFHHPNPATEVDTSNGGQVFPPYSGAAARRSRGYDSANQHGSSYAERSTHAAPGHEQSFVGQQQNHQHQQSQQQETDALITWPADDMWMSASIMDASHDPFFQFQDHDIPWAGSWEIGNL